MEAEEGAGQAWRRWWRLGNYGALLLLLLLESFFAFFRWRNACTLSKDLAPSMARSACKVFVLPGAVFLGLVRTWRSPRRSRIFSKARAIQHLFPNVAIPGSCSGHL